MSLYRKYRPMTFSDVVGQEHITKTLANEVKNNHIGHAYLFCGTRGTGKTSVAKILSRAVNCTDLRENGDPCNVCDACMGLINGTNTDVLEIDAASNNGVDHVRALRSEVLYAPSYVRFRVYIIDEVHMMSTSAFNALLKTLEEPPEHAIFILATTEAHKVPITIQSRCQRFDFRRISDEDIANRLLKVAESEGFSLEPQAAAALAKLADGAMRDALSGLDSVRSAAENVTIEAVYATLGLTSSEKYGELAKNIIEGDCKRALELSNEIIASSGDASGLASGLIGWFLEDVQKNGASQKALKALEALSETLMASKGLPAQKELILSTITVITGGES